GALDRLAQLLHHRRVEAVALVRAVQPDQRDLAVKLVGDRLFLAHDFSWFCAAGFLAAAPPRLPLESFPHGAHAAYIDSSAMSAQRRRCTAALQTATTAAWRVRSGRCDGALAPVDAARRCERAPRS